MTRIGLWKCIVVVMLYGGCASVPEVPPTFEELHDDARNLRVTVESTPVGASVYGVDAKGEIGGFIGITPVTIRYLARRRFWGTPAHPDETLVARVEDSMPWSTAKSYLAFRCYLVQDGYRREAVYHVIEDKSHGWGPFAFGQIEAFRGGLEVRVHRNLVSR